MILTVRSNTAAKGTGFECADLAYKDSLGHERHRLGQADIRQAHRLGLFSGRDSLKSRTESMLLGESHARVVTRTGGQTIKHDAKITDLLPGVGSQAKVLCTPCRIENRHGNGIRPPAGFAIVQDHEHRLCQGELATQRRVKTVVEEVIVEQPMIANLAEILLAVDKRTMVSPRHGTVNVLKAGQAALR